MGQHPVKTYSYPKDDQGVATGEQDQIRLMNCPLPKHPDSQQRGEERNNNTDKHAISIGCNGLHSASALSSSAIKSRTLISVSHMPTCFRSSMLCNECFHDGAAIHTHFSLFTRAGDSHTEKCHVSLTTDENRWPPSSHTQFCIDQYSLDLFLLRL